jgi:hypothetical protein
MKNPSDNGKSASPYGQIVYFRVGRYGDILLSDPSGESAHISFDAESYKEMISIRDRIRRRYDIAIGALDKPGLSHRAFLAALLKTDTAIAGKFREMYKGDLRVYS